MTLSKSCKVVLTGGPGGGKTTAADLYHREIGNDVVIVPEVATMLYSSGFPRKGNSEVLKAAQKAIFHVQRNMEEAQAELYHRKVYLCDRGTVDGAIYWPENNPNDFFKEMNTTLEQELNRYDAVLFFETAAVGNISIEGGNPQRIESINEAIELDKRLRSLWEKHPHFVFVPHHPSFIHKVNTGLIKLAEIVKEKT